MPSPIREDDLFVLPIYSAEIVQVQKSRKEIRRPDQTSPLVNRLPNEIILKILEDFRPQDLRKMRGTCFQFNELIRERLRFFARQEFRELESLWDICKIEKHFVEVEEIKLVLDIISGIWSDVKLYRQLSFKNRNNERFLYEVMAPGVVTMAKSVQGLAAMKIAHFVIHFNFTSFYKYMIYLENKVFMNRFMLINFTPFYKNMIYLKNSEKENELVTEVFMKRFMPKLVMQISEIYSEQVEEKRVIGELFVENCSRNLLLVDLLVPKIPADLQKWVWSKMS